MEEIITTRIYLEDSYCREFEARIRERLLYKEKPALILDKTCFYPESGGQPHDTGWINEVRVVAVVEEGEEVIHLLEKEVAGDWVRGKIDWKRRFDHMQQHAGQHILSQSFFELLKGETLSFHLGELVSTVEINIEEIDEDEVEKIERRANSIVFEDREIKTYFIPKENIDSIPLRKPPKKEGLIRVVEVSEYDYSACGGTHPKRTGEVGLIKILKWERIRGNLRFEFLCGSRAVEDYILKNRLLRELSRKFTVQDRDVLSSVEKVLTEVRDLKRENRRLLEQSIENEAQRVAREAEGKIIQEIFENRAVEEIRNLAIKLIKKGSFVVLYGIRGKERVHLILARSDEFGIDLRRFVGEISRLIEGKGGGQPSLVEISGVNEKNLEFALLKAKDSIEKEI